MYLNTALTALDRLSTKQHIQINTIQTYVFVCLVRDKLDGYTPFNFMEYADKLGITWHELIGAVEGLRTIKLANPKITYEDKTMIANLQNLTSYANYDIGYQN